EVDGGQSRGDNAIHFFREGLREIAGAEAGLDVADGDALVKSGERATERRSGVALDDHEGGSFLAEDGLELRQNVRRGLRERLAGLHAIEIVLGRDAKRGEHLIEHAAMLRGNAGARDEFAALLRVEECWREFDGFGPGAENEEQLAWVAHHPR